MLALLRLALLILALLMLALLISAGARILGLPRTSS